MDEKTLLARSRACRTIVAEVMNFLTDAIKFQLRFRDYTEPGALRGSQLAVPYKEDDDVRPEEERESSEGKKCFGFASSILCAWAYNPCAVWIDSAFLRPLNPKAIDPVTLHRLVGCPVFIPFARPRQFFSPFDAEGVLLGVTPGSDGSVFCHMLPIVSKFKMQGVNLPLRIPSEKELWPDYLEAFDSDERIGFVLRALFFLASDLPQPSAWRAAHILRADVLKEKHLLFTELGRPIAATIFTPESVNTGNIPQIPYSDPRLVRRPDINGPSDLVRVAEKEAEEWRNTLNGVAEAVVVTSYFPVLAGLRVSCCNIADRIDEEIRRHPGFLEVGTLLRIANASRGIGHFLDSYLPECRIQKFSAYSDFLNSMTLILNRVRELLIQWSPETAKVIPQFDGNDVDEITHYIYGCLWHKRNNEKAIAAAPLEVMISPEAVKKLYLSSEMLLIDLAELSSVEARRLYEDFIHEFSLVGAMSEARGGISYLLTWKLYRLLVDIARLLPKKAQLPDTIRLAIGQGLLAAGNKNEIGQIREADAEEVFRMATGSRNIGDMLLEDYEEDLKRFRKDPIMAADCISIPWYHPGF